MHSRFPSHDMGSAWEASSALRGMTSLINAVPGSRQKVAKLPGVKVERKDGNSSHSEGGAFCKQINSLVCEQKP